MTAPIVVVLDPPRCPYCGEDRVGMVERDPVGGRYFCGVCGRTWVREFRRGSE
jgi:transposase-like protein